jgi:hypothetical protein
MGTNARSARRADRTRGQKSRRQKTVTFKTVPKPKKGGKNGTGKQGR